MCIRDRFVRYSSNEGIGDSGSFQKIKYVLENGILKRYSSNFLNSPYLKDYTPLILNVSEVKLDNPLAFSSNSNDLNTIPIIINFKIKIKEVFFNKIFVVSNA